jgi:gluconolactonase
MELRDVRVVAEGLAFPEGPVALGDGAVVVVEIGSGRVTRIGADGDRTVLAEVGGGPNGAALGPDGSLYLCNNGGMGRERTVAPSIQRLDPATGEVDVLYTESAGRPLVAPNDLVFDDTGHFWFTDFGGDTVNYASPDGASVEAAVRGVRSPNGIGLSPGGDVVYWAETYTRQLHRRRLERPGVPVASPHHGVPSLMAGRDPDPWTLVVGLPGRRELDSLAVEAGGAVCVGTLLDSGITVVDPETGSHETWTLPPSLADGAVTNICFGGADLMTAWITCSLTGRLVSCRWPRPGLRLAFQELPER